MTRISAYLRPFYGDAAKMVPAMVRAGWQWLRSRRYGGKVLPSRPDSVSSPCRASGRAVGRVKPTVRRMTPELSAEFDEAKSRDIARIKARLGQHQPTRSGPSERGCVMCGELFPCRPFRDARAELAGLYGVQPPRPSDPEGPLSALARSVSDDGGSGSSSSFTQYWQETFYRVAMAICWRERSRRQWERFGQGAIRLATPGACCASCASGNDHGPQIAFEFYFDGLGNQVVCWPHLLNPI